MENNKIFIFLPDGIGLRNFAYSEFHTIGNKKGFEVYFWNNTPFNLTSLGFDEIIIKNAKINPLTDIYKNARKHIELNLNIKKTNDKVYDSYRFPFSYKNFNSAVKSIATVALIKSNNSDSGLLKIRDAIKKKERKTDFYKESLETLKEEKPAIVFCTNQRIASAVAPILAAQDLGISTATFIFSWDNLPKATMVVETDYYFVWSEYMKKELQFYYPYIEENQIFITGTPQFENHFDKELLIDKSLFYRENGLDLYKKYICFSGDDITTSPNDSQYLADIAVAVKILNEKGFNLGIIFRRCPVDFSSRYDNVLENNKEIIKVINPKWEKISSQWNAYLPTKEDLILQMNTVFYSELAINLGSSMIFDFASHNKPCGYINYNAAHSKFPNWTVEKIYKYVHFKSMPSKDSVFWLDNAEEISSKIEDVLMLNSKKTIKNAKKWFEIINLHPANEASERIWNEISKILS